MKKIKILSLLLVGVLMMTLLSGCMVDVIKVEINSDGSNSVEAIMGISESLVEVLKEISIYEGNTSFGFDDLEQLQKAEYNGIKYYDLGNSAEYLDSGMKETYNSITELNDMFDNLTYEMSLTDSIIKITQDLNGAYTLYVSEDILDLTEILENVIKEICEANGIYITLPTELPESDYTREELELYTKLLKTLEDKVYTFEFKFPDVVRQIEGNTEGITINGNSVILDLYEMNRKPSDYVFTTGKELIEELFFTDVKSTDWYYTAIISMAKSGIVNGVGNHLFKPEDVMTNSQFCQLLAKAKSLKTGGNTYWAEDAIKSCIEVGYIQDLGSIVPEIWDTPITRETAIVGMLKAYFEELPIQNANITANDIPDINEVNSQYREDIVKAYQYGITQGVDNIGTFVPKDVVYRSVMCQLLYNCINNESVTNK